MLIFLSLPHILYYIIIGSGTGIVGIITHLKYNYNNLVVTDGSKHAIDIASKNVNFIMLQVENKDKGSENGVVIIEGDGLSLSIYIYIFTYIY